MLVFALTIFTGAFLLFQVQPLIAKYILPWFGGGPGVWTVCMLFFQVLLLGGYAYAHCTSKWLKPRAQALVHLTLLAAAVALLPITPGDAWKPTGAQDPTGRILLLLAASLGLPYFVLSSTGPLMQQWFSLSNPGRSPYRLYALSNVGSLLALVSYPFFFETHFTRKTQAWLWGCGLVLFVLFCAGCALALWKTAGRKAAAEELRPKAQGPSAEDGVERPAPSLANRGSAVTVRPLTLLLWLVLPACASVMLLATTNKLCQDVAVMPFLWVAPLSIYLLSFIICFDSPQWYERAPFRVLLVAALGALYWAIPRGSETALVLLLAVYSAALFICCMVCHGELYRLRPEPEHLTTFYLMIAAGGALGGVLVAVVAPLVFNDYYELHLGALLCGLLVLVACARDRTPQGLRQSRWLAWMLPLVVLVALDRLLAHAANHWGENSKSGLVVLRIAQGAFLLQLAYVGLESRALDRPGARVWPALVRAFVPWAGRKRFCQPEHWPRLACAWLGAGLLVLAIGLWQEAHQMARLVVEQTRNFYGVLTMIEDGRDDPRHHNRELLHGQILHGLQMLDPIGATWPTTYYNEMSGVGLALRALPKTPRRVAVAGLGVGTLAAYGRTNDYFCFYEINPEALRMADTGFTYLTNCRAAKLCKLGDARLVLEREPPQRYDLLALDAFAGDSPPVHLLTKEAFQCYERHLNTNGVIAVNISNKYLDLESVVVTVARELNLDFVVTEANPWDPVVAQSSPTGETWWLSASTWVLLSRNRQFFDAPSIRRATRPAQVTPGKVHLWTDDFTSLFEVMK
ncbi:MAG: spermidine synthase [Limisphaerales bacterium]